MVAPLHVEKSDSNNNCGQSVRSTNIGRRWHVSVLPTLVLARSANDAGASTAAQSGRTQGTARLPYGSGKTKGEASQSSSIPLLPLREPAPPALDDAGTYPSCQRCFAATLRVRQDERRGVAPTSRVSMKIDKSIVPITQQDSSPRLLSLSSA